MSVVQKVEARTEVAVQRCRGVQRKADLCAAIPNYCYLSSLSDGAPLKVAVTFLERSSGLLPALSHFDFLL